MAPSTRRWSADSVSFITCRISTAPSTATGVGPADETARMAASPGLMIALNSSTPNMPRFETVNVLPVRSSTDAVPSRAAAASAAARSWICSTVSRSASRMTGTTSPVGTDTAMPRWTRLRDHTDTPSVRELTSGNSASVSAVAASTKIRHREAGARGLELGPEREQPRDVDGDRDREVGCARPALGQALGDDPAYPGHRAGGLLAGRLGRSDGCRRHCGPGRDRVLHVALDDPAVGPGARDRPGIDAALRREPARAGADRQPGARAGAAVDGPAGAGVVAAGVGAAGASGAAAGTGVARGAAATGSVAAASAGASGTASPASPTQAQMLLTGTDSPAWTTILSRTPSSKASTSMTDLSVSISNRTSPRWTGSPSFLCHSTTEHSSVIWPGLRHEDRVSHGAGPSRRCQQVMAGAAGGVRAAP